ncbi:MAG: CinA family protein [Candidatus Lokiarchaeota archaeon]|nr:CinA family protein [Candidatus Lokiarchaeota archaeon]
MEKKNSLKKIVERLSKENIRIAIAESCTGGYVSSQITSVPGASKIFERGLICYSNQAKIDLLGLEADVVIKNGAVSEIVASQMAKKVREKSGVQIGVSVTGIAGPGGGTEKKPVGLVYIGFSTQDNLHVEKKVFQADRKNFRKLVLNYIIDKLEDLLKK